MAWQSQVRGLLYALRGTVVAFIPAGEDITEHPEFPTGISSKQVRCRKVATVDRYFVLGEYNGKQAVFAPYASRVEESVARAATGGLTFSNGELTTGTEARIRTPEELLAASGLDPLEWRVAEKGLTINSWETNGGDGKVMPLFQVKLRLDPCIEGRALREMKDRLLAEIRAQVAGAYVPVDLRVPESQPYLGEVCIFDAHLQSLVWGREAGEDYDLEIAAEEYRKAAEYLLARIAQHNPERILWPIGQDFFHTDALIAGKGGATHRGTPQDVDSRWQKGFMVARQMLTALLLSTAEEVAPIDLIIEPGNHDRTKSWYLGEVLSATFSQHPSIRVDNRPVQRKYYSYGRNLLGFTHGDQENPRQLALLMAQEAREDWGNTVFREWHLGHRHKEWVDEEMGVRSRIIPALAPADSWHNQQGFVQNIRGARGFVWKLSGGMEAIYPYEIAPSLQHLRNIGPLLRGDS